MQSLEADILLTSESGESHFSYVSSPTPEFIPHKDHPLEQIIGDIDSGVQKRAQTEDQHLISGQATAIFCLY